MAAKTCTKCAAPFTYDLYRVDAFGNEYPDESGKCPRCFAEQFEAEQDELDAAREAQQGEDLGA